MTASRAVWRFYAYRVSVSNGFWLPVGVLYLQRVRGFGLGEIGLIMGTFSVAMVAAEIPTGYVADRLGKRACLLLGNVVVAAFMVGYVLVESVGAYLALHVFWAFGWAFRSGTADAWLYELLAADGDDDEFARVRGRASTVRMGFEAVTAALAGALVVVDWSLPFLANAAVAVFGIPVLLSLPATTGDADDPEDRFTVGTAVETLRLQARRPDVRWFVAYVLLFSVLYQVSYTFEQPALDAVGIRASQLGVVYAGFKLVAAGAASTAGWVGDRLGVRTVFGLLAPLWAVAFLGVAVAPVAIVPVLFLNRAVHAVTRPIRNQYLNDRIDDVGRATVLSGVSMVGMTTGGIAKFVAGEVADAVGLIRFFVVAGVAIAVTGAVLWLVASPVRSSEKVDDRAREGPVPD